LPAAKLALLFCPGRKRKPRTWNPGLGVIRLSNQPKNNTALNSDTRPDLAAFGVRLFKLKVQERSRLMLKAVAVRPEPQDIIRRYNPAANRPDPVSEVQKGVREFRGFLHDVNKIGLEELKPKGERETSTFIREMLRRHFFAEFKKYKKILWEAVTNAEWPPFTYWPPAKKLFEEEIEGDGLPPDKARGSLKAEWGNRFKIRIAQLELEEQESQPRPFTQASEIRSWPEIEIVFLSDERVGIVSVGDRKTYNYTELGFEDRRNGTPNGAWTMLREIAKKNGTIPRPSPGKDRATIQKRIEEIREKLRSHFKIEGDPVPFNGNTYQASFKISCGASFEE
jgi:hypothetical protein